MLAGKKNYAGFIKQLKRMSKMFWVFFFFFAGHAHLMPLGGSTAQAVTSGEQRLWFVFVRSKTLRSHFRKKNKNKTISGKLFTG